MTPPRRAHADRCYELGGWESNITANTGFCGHQRAANTPYDTVDGEGILDQLWDSTNGMRNLLVSNDLAVTIDGQQGQTGFIAFYNLRDVVGNVLVNNTVLPTEFIGATKGSFSANGTNAGNVCEGNTPPCVDMNP